MGSVTVKINGLQQLGEAMRALSSEMNLKIARSATGKGASVIRKRARELAPVAPPQVTPKIPYLSLQNAIVAKRVPPSQSAFTAEHLVTILGGRKNDFASHVGALQEFGTVKMSPHPFMRPAFDQEKGFALAAIVQAIRDGIDKAVAKV